MSVAPGAVPVVDLWVDLVCPWCRVNHVRLVRVRDELAAEGVHVDVVHRPFQLAPGQPPGVRRRDHVARAFGDVERADAAFEHVRAVGAAEGVEFRFDLIELEPNTLDAHRLLRYAQRPGVDRSVAPAVASAVYEAFFVRGQDIGDVGTLVGIGADAGLEADRLAGHLRSTADAAVVLREAEAARALGVRGVPTYGVAGRPVGTPPEAQSLRAFLLSLAGQGSSTG